MRTFCRTCCRKYCRKYCRTYCRTNGRTFLIRTSRNRFCFSFQFLSFNFHTFVTTSNIRFSLHLNLSDVWHEKRNGSSGFFSIDFFFLQKFGKKCTAKCHTYVSNETQYDESYRDSVTFQSFRLYRLIRKGGEVQ